MVNPPLILELGADINASCVDTTVVSAATLSGSGIINYQWFAGGIPQAINSANFSYQSNATIPIVVNGIDQCGMVDSDTTTIIIPNIPIVLTTSNDTSICYMADAQLFAQATGGEGVFNYYWPDLDENGQNQYLNDVMGSHTYTVVVTEICGHVLIDTIHVEVVPVSAVFQFNELAENLFEFLPDSCQNCLYAWDFGDGITSSDVVVQHQFDGLEQYEVNLTVTNEIGCVDQGTYTVIAPPLYYVPSAFTPNSDGVNDAFGLVGENIDEFDLKIFNRWGDIVFHSIDPKDHWMGDYQGQADYYVPNGIYPFVIEMKGYDFGSKIIKGTILLNR
jgi:gliding motility-associated-like protein